MLREEAEREASRRNLEDPDRDRYEFYAFDESAGLSADAWDVAARLRQSPSAARPATAAAAARRARETAPAHEELAYAEPAYEPAHTEPADPQPAYEEPHYEQPAYEPAVYEEPPAEVAYAPDPALAQEVYEEPPARLVDEDRPGFFVRLVGAIVVLAGLAWIAMVVVLAVFLNPNDATSLGIYVAAALLGIMAIGLGVAIRRS